jgi:hypothetical protein
MVYGKAKYFNDGPYFEQVVKLFTTPDNNPKGAILVTVSGLNQVS